MRLDKRLVLAILCMAYLHDMPPQSELPSGLQDAKFLVLLFQPPVFALGRTFGVGILDLRECNQTPYSLIEAGAQFDRVDTLLQCWIFFRRNAEKNIDIANKELSLFIHDIIEPKD